MNYFLTFILSFFISQTAPAESYSLYEEDGRFGIKNQSGTVLIPALYESLGWSDGTFSVVDQVTGYKKGELWGVITITNEIITQPEYFSLYPGSASLIVGSKRSSLTFRVSTGCINSAGKVVIPFLYSGLKIHSLQAITFMLDDNQLKYGLIDLNNKVILPSQYKNIYPIGSLRYAVQRFDNKTALFAENGKQVTDFLIDSISSVQYGLAVIYQEGKQGLIDREGQIIEKPIYREIELRDKTYYTRMPDEWFILEPSSRIINQLEADSIKPISNAQLKIVTAKGSVLSDLDLGLVGKTINLSQIQSFRNGLAVYTKNGKAGVIRTNGSVLFDANFDRIHIDNNYLQVLGSRDGKRWCALYDTAGNQISRKLYDDIKPFNGSYFPVLKNGYMGGIDNKGNEILACAYDSLLETAMGLTVVKFKGLFAIISTSEQWLVTPQRNRISLINRDVYFEKADSTTFLKSMDGRIIYFTTNSIQLHNSMNPLAFPFLIETFHPIH